MTSTTLRLIFAALALIASLITLYLDRQGALALKLPEAGRVSVALLGIAAAAGLAAGRRPAGTIGWPLALVWALVQIPVYTTVESGWINQTALRFPLALTYSLRENNQLVSHLQAGVNLAALAYAVMLSRRRQEIASPYAARHSAGGSRSAGRSRIEREASR